MARTGWPGVGIWIGIGTVFGNKKGNGIGLGLGIGIGSGTEAVRALKFLRFFVQTAEQTEIEMEMETWMWMSTKSCRATNEAVLGQSLNPA